MTGFTRGYLQSRFAVAYGPVTLYGTAFRTVSASKSRFLMRPHNPVKPKPDGLGCFLFARRYWGNRFFFLFLRVLRCFSSPRSHGNLGINICLTIPPSFSQPSTPLCLLTPRHPPYALSSLTRLIFASHAHHQPFKLFA